MTNPALGLSRSNWSERKKGFKTSANTLGSNSPLPIKLDSTIIRGLKVDFLSVTGNRIFIHVPYNYAVHSDV